MTFRIITANIRSFPEMTPRQYTADMKKALRLAPIGGTQETTPPKYVATLARVAKRLFFKRNLINNTGLGGSVIFLNPKRFTVIAKGHEKFTDGVTGVTPDRYITWALVKEKATGVVFIITNKQYVAGYGNHPKIWNDSHVVDVEFVLTLRKRYGNVPVVMIGDYNNGDPHVYAGDFPGQELIYIQHTIDKIIFMNGDQHQWIVGGKTKKTFPANSDHDFLAVTASLVLR